MKRAVIIVSNENLNAPIFIRDILDNNFHVWEMNNFCRKYNLDITLESLGIEEGDVHGLSFQYALASQGHLVITAGEMLLVFLPSHLDYRQVKWLQDNTSFFKKNKKILAYGIVNENGEIINEGDYQTFYNTILNKESELKL